jgi:hypothetical protein
MKKLSKYFLISAGILLSSCSQEVDIPIEGAIASSSVPSNAAFIETLVHGFKQLQTGYMVK